MLRYSRKIRFFRRLACILTLILAACEAHAISFNLDSIAAMGKFPNFCINVYRWGDGFFNGYDKNYVLPAGYKFNVKFRSDNWIDGYNFTLPNDMRMSLISEPSTSIGVWLTYLALSVGYDKNISKIFGSGARAREQFNFGFNCSLFSANISYLNNKQGTKITKFGPKHDTYNPHLDFNGVYSKTLAISMYYFFNHKRYSQAAAFSFSRIQTRSQGSWFAGFTYFRNNYSFDFSDLPPDMLSALPPSWNNYQYFAKNKNYSIKFGYGYNWVFARHWMFAVSESPSLGIKKGFINADKEKTSLSMMNSFRIALVWNNKRWFAGLVGNIDNNLIYDRDTTFASSQISGNICIGYRFDIW